MGKNAYSTKDICEIFGIGRETLRHYERMGILNPPVNPDNGYREYGYWDVGRVVDILKFRSSGVPISQAKEALFEMNYHGTVELLKERKEYFKEQIEYYRVMEEKAKRELVYLEFAENHLNELAQTEVPELLYVPMVEYERDDPDGFHTMQKALQHSQFFSTVWIMTKDCYPSEEEPLNGLGFIAEKRYVKNLKLKKGTAIPKAKVLGEILDVAGRNLITAQHFSDFEDKIAKWDGKEQLSEETYAILLSRFYDEQKEYHQYFAVYKRIEGSI